MVFGLSKCEAPRSCKTLINRSSKPRGMLRKSCFESQGALWIGWQIGLCLAWYKLFSQNEGECQQQIGSCCTDLELCDSCKCGSLQSSIVPTMLTWTLLSVSAKHFQTFLPTCLCPDIPSKLSGTVSPAAEFFHIIAIQSQLSPMEPLVSAERLSRWHIVTTFDPTWSNTASRQHDQRRPKRCLQWEEQEHD